MRDGSARRRSTSPRPTNWTKRVLQLANWRESQRFEEMCALAHSARDLTWSRGLLGALLEELHVSDDFDVLVGRVAHLPASQYPRLLAVALLLRHSWCPEDLERVAKRLGLTPHASAPKPRIAGACGHRRRLLARTSLAEPRTR
jgi:hypothetical protein